MTIATTSAAGEIVLGGDLTGTATYPELRATGVIPGTYAPVQRMTVDAKGRVVSVGQTTQAEIMALVGDTTETTLGLMKPGTGLVVSSGVVSVPFASYTTKGIFQVGAGLSVSSGVVSAPNGTDTTKGILQVGSGLSVTAGVVSLNAPFGTDTTKGILQVGSGLSVTAGVVTLPDATDSSKGILRVGSGLAVSSGVVSIQDASETSKGIVQIGSGLSVTGGVLSLAALPDATDSSKGILQVGSGLSVTSGVVSAPLGTDTTKGILQVGAGLSISAGVISLAPLPNGTDTTKGILQVGSGLSVTAGVVSLNAPFGTDSSKGILQVGSGLSVASGVMSLATLPLASGSVFGAVQPGTNTVVSAGVLATSFPDATFSTKGVVLVDADGLDVVAGEMSLSTTSASRAAILALSNTFSKSFACSTVGSITFSGLDYGVTTLPADVAVVNSTTEYNSVVVNVNTPGSVLDNTMVYAFSKYWRVASGVLKSSSDGFIWSNALNGGSTIGCVGFGDGALFLVGSRLVTYDTGASTDTCTYSDNGTTWTTVDLSVNGSTVNNTCVLYTDMSNSRSVTCLLARNWNGSSFDVIRSTDGYTFTTVTFSGSISGDEIVVHNGSALIAYNYTTAIKYSADNGVTWSTSGSTLTSAFLRNSVSTNGAIFYGFGPTNKFWISNAAGSTWSSTTLATAYANNPSVIPYMQFAVGSRIVYLASDGATFRVSDNTGTSWSSVFPTIGAGSFRAFGQAYGSTKAFFTQGYSSDSEFLDTYYTTAFAFEYAPIPPVSTTISIPTYSAGSELRFKVSPTKAVQFTFPASVKVGSQPTLVAANSRVIFVLLGYSESGSSSATSWILKTENV